ncbi:hypothetical protein NL676_007902 [Syzygium grande]|nr:hypothetical protein NL676_007902 [Syzygium grande]
MSVTEEIWDLLSDLTTREPTISALNLTVARDPRTGKTVLPRKRRTRGIVDERSSAVRPPSPASRAGVKDPAKKRGAFSPRSVHGSWVGCFSEAAAAAIAGFLCPRTPHWCRRRRCRRRPSRACAPSSDEE